MKPLFWKKACQELAKKDPVLAKIIKNYHGEFLKTRGKPFDTLARSIVGQQISVKAADTVWGRFMDKLPSGKLNPEVVQKMDPATLRSCGLSERKVEYLKDLSRHFIENQVHPSKWSKMSDEEIIKELVDIRGIGRWSAEMFLIFYLLRPNVFPKADLGLQKAISIHYKKKYPLTKTNLEKFERHFSPWASVATWYLWRSLDPVPVEY